MSFVEQSVITTQHHNRQHVPEGRISVIGMQLKGKWGDEGCWRRG